MRILDKSIAPQRFKIKIIWLAPSTMYSDVNSSCTSYQQNWYNFNTIYHRQLLCVEIFNQIYEHKNIFVYIMCATFGSLILFRCIPFINSTVLLYKYKINDPLIPPLSKVHHSSKLRPTFHKIWETRRIINRFLVH